MAIPSLSYTEFKYRVLDREHLPQSKEITLDHLPDVGETFPISFNEGFNTIKIKFTPSTPLVYYEVRASKATEPFGIGFGTRWYHDYNVAGSEEYSFTLTVTSEYFEPDVDEGYIIGLFGKSSDSEGYWDVHYIFCTSEGEIYAPSDYDGIEFQSNEPIPSA